MESITTSSAEAVKAFVIQRIQQLIDNRYKFIEEWGMPNPYKEKIDNEIRLLTMLRNDLRGNIAIIERPINC